MVVVLVLLVLAAVLAVGVALSDRAVAGLAERRASAYLSAPLVRTGQSGVEVRVHGSPFLTQAVRGRYGDVEVTATGLQLGTLSGVALHAHLVNAYVPLADLIARRASELPVEHVHGEVVIPYPELARVCPIPGLTFEYRGGRVVAGAALPIPGFSQLARLSGETVLTITETGGVWLRVRNVAFAGIAVPGIVLSQIVPTLSFAVPLPPLPYGLRIEHLIPTPAGLEVTGSARAVVFRGGRDPEG